MKNIIAIIILLSACGADVKSKDKKAVGNNGVATNNVTSSNNGTTNNGRTNNFSNNKTTNTTNNKTNNATNNTTNNTTPGDECGNGDLDTMEACEGFELRGKTCRSEGFDGGTLKCTNRCKLDDSDCEQCGNGVVEGNEACDGADLNGQSCASLDPGSIGDLACDNQCNFFTEECQLGLANCTALAGCLNDCQGTQPCSDNCVARAPQSSRNLYTAAAQCAADNNCQDQDCLDQFCKPEIDACLSE